MSRSRPDILTSRGEARPLNRLQAHLARDAEKAPGLRDVPLGELWLRHQPRKLVPDSVLDALLADDRAQPAALLAELERLAADPASPHAATLRGLHELAATICVHGVLVPLRLARMDDRYVVEEGHRRSLASLLAGLDRVPAIVADSASELLLAARQFVANDQRADLSALEKAAWLRDLMAKADRELRLRNDWPLDEPSFAALFEAGEDDPHPDPLPGGEGEDGPPGPPILGGEGRSAEAALLSPMLSPGQNGTPLARSTPDPNAAAPADEPPDPLFQGERAGVRASPGPSPPSIGGPGGPYPAATDRLALERHKGEVRAQVLSLTGLSLGRYYQLRQLNRLCPEARELGAALTERHLRPIVVLPPEGQVLVIRAILAHQVPANKVPTLVRALADGGAEALRRALTSLGLPSPRGRVASSYARIAAVPADWEDRVRLVAQELTTIKAPHARATRLAQLAEQAARLEALATAYRAILAQHGVEASAECRVPSSE
jgi:hypothetical protein